MKTIKPRSKRRQYRAVINWLTEYEPELNSSDLEQLRGYLEALHHLCQLKTWKSIKFILSIPININSSTVNLSLPLYEFLIFKGLVRDLLEVTQEIITALENTDNDITSVMMLKARALFDISDRADESKILFEQIRLQSQPDTEFYIEATARLGIRQIRAGLYQEGTSNCQKSLEMIDGFLKFHSQHYPDLKFQELKTDVLEALALYEMNSSNFERAMHLYGQLIRIRKEFGLIHRFIVPIGHQGILFKKIQDYEQSIKYLTQAKEYAIEMDNEMYPVWIDHHLAYTYLYQGNLLLAEKFCRDSLEGFKELKNRGATADGYEQLGFINLSKNEFGAAEKNFRISLDIRKSIGNLHGTASSTLHIAFALWHKRQFLNFIHMLLQGLFLYYKLGVLNHARLANLLKKTYIWTIGKKRREKIERISKKTGRSGGFLFYE